MHACESAWSHNHMHGPPGLVAWRWPPTPTAVVHRQVNLGRLRPGLFIISQISYEINHSQQASLSKDIYHSIQTMKTS